MFILPLLGIALTLGTIVWFASSDNDSWVAKQTVVEEPVAVGDGQGTKKTTTTDYSDTVVIFSLSAGVALILAGAFYGRLRELKLGALTVGLGALEASVEEKAKETAAKPEVSASAETLASEARRQAMVLLADPPPAVRRSVAEEAVRRAERLLAE